MSQFNRWFDKPLGGAVAESIQKQIELNRVSVLGECLQIGTTTTILKNNHGFMHIHKFMPCFNTHANVIGTIDALPFANQSFSMVFLPFTLEVASDFSPLLNEVNRVLTDDGLILIAGINPWSLWGAAHLICSNNLWSKGTKDIHLHSSLRLYAWLSSSGFQVDWIKSFFYRPPFSSKNTLKKTRFLEPIGQIFWPYPGGLYLLLAQKRTPQLLMRRAFGKVCA